jgi:hypothetical protein
MSQTYADTPSYSNPAVRRTACFPHCITAKATLNSINAGPRQLKRTIPVLLSGILVRCAFAIEILYTKNKKYGAMCLHLRKRAKSTCFAQLPTSNSSTIGNRLPRNATARANKCLTYASISFPITCCPTCVRLSILPLPFPPPRFFPNYGQKLRG